MEYSLYSQDQDKVVKWFDKYDKQAILTAIITHLTAYPNDILEHCKEYPKADIRRFYGNKVVNFYSVNPKNGKPSLYILKGDKTYFKALTS